MPQSLARVLIHLVFSTKNREAFIVPTAREPLFAYLAGTLNELGSPAISVGGHTDHVHLLFALSKSLPLAKTVEEIKKGSSKWAKANVHPEFFWQNGYGAFSVSPSNESRVVGYIASQEQHHTGSTFQDEYRVLLRKHGMTWDEQYVWD